jgi:hypothetical protein
LLAVISYRTADIDFICLIQSDTPVNSGMVPTSAVRCKQPGFSSMTAGSIYRQMELPGLLVNVAVIA